MTTDWKQLAACKGKTKLFFSVDVADIRRAVIISATCPVKELCAASMGPDDTHGVRAGRVFTYHGERVLGDGPVSHQPRRPRYQSDDGMLLCAYCGRLKPSTQFNVKNKLTGQRVSYCKPCHTDYTRDYRARKAKKAMSL